MPWRGVGDQGEKPVRSSLLCAACAVLTGGILTPSSDMKNAESGQG